MPKTSLEVISRAHRRIRILAHDEPLTAEQKVLGDELLQTLYAELQTVATFPWTIDAVDDDCYLPLSFLLAVELAPEYNRPTPETRSRAWLRLMAVLRPDDREDRRDVDDDGVISDAEEDAGRRAAFY